jgi:chloramphenicol O-acetyltransferase type B
LPDSGVQTVSDIANTAKPGDRSASSQGISYKVRRSQVEIGRFTYGAETMVVHQWGEGASLRIGAFCSIGKGLQVYLGGNHRTDWSTTFPFGKIFARELGGRGIVGHPQSRGDVVIGNDVWIGQNVSILSGLEIGDGAVIALNATVTKSVGPYEIWGGNPARLLRPRFPATIADRLQALKWWECSVGAVRELAPLLSTPPDSDVLSALEAIVARDRRQKEGPG